MHASAIWHGTAEEAETLETAVLHNCTCTRAASGCLGAMCSAHRLLWWDQRALDGLLFARRMAGHFQREEWMTARSTR